jgi:zinc protease
MVNFQIIKSVTLWSLFTVLCVWTMAVGKQTSNSGKSAHSVVGEPYHSSAMVLENGMEVVLIENHSNPMVACFMIVRCGQRDETEDIAGVGHLLEHAIFDGTEHRSKKQLYDDFDFLGSYVNASTKSDYTEFFILGPKETFPQSLDLLNDMVFHSVFPPDTLEQEKGIVIEEIGKDFQEPSTKVDNHFDHLLYQGTPYAHPILGSAANIAALPRKKLVDFYETYYVPNNMVCVVIGDVVPKDMFELIQSTFGGYPSGKIPHHKTLKLSSFATSAVNQVIRYQDEVDKCYLKVGIKIPKFEDEDYFPMQVLLGMIEPYLTKCLIIPQDSSITDISFQNFEDKDFTTLIFSLDISSEAVIPQAMNRLFQALSSLYKQVTKDKVMAELQSLRSMDIIQGQRLQMYGMMNSPLFARGGYPLWKSYFPALGQVKVDDIVQVAIKYFDHPNYVATCLVPFSEKESSETTGLQMVAALRDTLANGLVVMIQQNQDAPIFSAHLIARGRAFREGKQHAGYVDILQRIMGKSLQVDDESLTEALKRIGAEFETNDNPYIPYDDYRTTPEYSFMRMECLDDFRMEALDLLAEVLTRTPITEGTFSSTKNEQMGILSSQSTKASVKANQLLAKKLLGEDNPLAQPEIGTMETIGSATLQDIQLLYDTYFCGSNLILTMVSAGDPQPLMQEVHKKFDLLLSQSIPPVIWSKPSSTPGHFEEQMGKRQSSIRIGEVFIPVDSSDKAALQVWTGWVADQLATTIREEKGWAYSAGAGVEFVDDWALWKAGWDTSPATVDASLPVARDVINQCLTQKPSSHELQRIVNQLLRSEGMRRMTRINQAMYLGLTLMDGRDRDYNKWSKGIRGVTVEDLHRVATKYFNFNDITEVVIR